MVVATPFLLQRIILLAKRTFASSSIPNEKLQRLISLCNKLTLKDILPSVQALNETSDAPVRYVSLLEEETVSIGIFLLQRNAVLPLHNHPNMTVLSKCIHGSARIESFDWADAAMQAVAGSPALAKFAGHTTVNAQTETELVFPHERNLHRIEVDEPCMFLDIISPPYSNDRPCVYYRIPDDVIRQDAYVVGKSYMLEVTDMD